MTAIVDALTPSPQRPWRNARRATAVNGLVLALAATLALLAVKLTGLAGPIGLFAGFALSLPVVVALDAARTGGKRLADRMAAAVLSVAFATVMIPWISLVFSVIKRGYRAIYTGFFTHDMLVNSADDPLNMGGISHAIVGTAIMVGIAALIAVPLGIVAGIYVVEIKGRFTRLVRFLTQAMSGVPSIVAGLFVYATLVSVMHRYNALAGACSLTVLMLPTVARTTEEVLKVVPRELRDASYAMGATQLRTTMKVVLPTVRSGLITAAVLGVARVAGETAPLLLTAQYFVKFTTDVYEGPIASLPVYIFQNLGVGTENAMARAWGGSIVLIGLVVLLSLMARLFSGRVKGK